MEGMLFQDAKRGDIVAVPFSDGTVGKYTVTKVTPTQIVVNGGSRYRRDNGHRIGERNGSITQWTTEHDTRLTKCNAGARLVMAAKALEKVASHGWNRVHIPHDPAAAMKLAEAIEAYLAGMPK